MLEKVDAGRTMQVVSEVQAKTGYVFDPDEAAGVIQHTARKCELNGKDESYFYILLENELRDFLMRARINALGRLNERRRELCVMCAT